MSTFLEHWYAEDLLFNDSRSTYIERQSPQGRLILSKGCLISAHKNVYNMGGIIPNTHCNEDDKDNIRKPRINYLIKIKFILYCEYSLLLLYLSNIKISYIKGTPGVIPIFFGVKKTTDDVFKLF